MIEEKGLDLDIIEQKKEFKQETRQVDVPLHRLTPLKNNWEKITEVIVKNLLLQIRMNVPKRIVEMRSTPDSSPTSLNKAYEFLKAFMLGFSYNDSLALLRIDDLYIESFEIKDVKNLVGQHLSRCIARISGQKGKTKNAIENSTKCRIVIAGSKIHILGAFGNIKVARNAICSLILGAPAGKVYMKLKGIIQN